MEDSKPHKVSPNPEYGFLQLDPVPARTDIDAFYESQYYELIKKGGRAPELRRLMAGGEEEKRERDWLAATLYADIRYMIDAYADGRRVMDIGCGTGDMIENFCREGLDAVGIEPSEDAVAIAREKGLSAEAMTLERYVELHQQESREAFDVVTLVNVLEHVPDPVEVVKLCSAILKPGGCIFIRVPNDFNPFQEDAQKALGHQPWWIAVPDHINYFNFESLRGLLEALGFEMAYEQGDFPMDMFLLMGDDYVGDPGKGGECHARRVKFETNLDGDKRRALYQAFAGLGIGRDCMVFARKKS